MSTPTTKIAIVDDHSMIRQALTTLISNNGNYSVIFDAGNGRELQQKLLQNEMPDIILLDIAMPEMDGYETAQWLRTYYPDIKILIMSVSDSQEILLQMVKLGVHGFILKESDLEEILLAFKTLKKHGFYFTSKLQGYMTSLIKNSAAQQPVIFDAKIQALNMQERKFLELLCTELTYNEICSLMHISYHTLDNYRDAIYKKLNVKSRTGSVLYAVKSGLVQV